MKKNLVFVAIIGFVIATLSGCGGNSASSHRAPQKVSSKELNSQSDLSTISEKEKKELVENLNYKKACELKEFPTAYEIVDNLKKETSEKKVYADKYFDEALRGLNYAIEYASKYEEAKKVSDEAERYVVLQEAMFVLESEGSNGLMRVVGIGKEHNAESWLYPELLDVAKKIGDTDLANRFETIIQSTISNLSSGNVSLSDISLIKYMAETKDKNNSEKIIGLLAEKEKKIPGRPALGVVKSNSYGKLDKPYVDYNTSVKNYNDACRAILDIAIASKNQYLAQRVITKAKQSLASVELGDWCKVVEKTRYNSLYNAFKVTLDNSEINSIKATYQEAIRSGAFE